MLRIEGTKNFIIDNAVAMFNSNFGISGQSALAVKCLDDNWAEVVFSPALKTGYAAKDIWDKGFLIPEFMLNMLIRSKKTYMFGFYYSKHRTIESKDNMPDDRYPWMNGKPVFTFPRYEDVDGYVYVNSELQVIDRHSGRIVSMRAVVFHELAECFARVDLEMMGADAHKYACDLEIKVQNQWDAFTSGLAGYGEKILAGVKYNRSAIPTVKKREYKRLW